MMRPWFLLLCLMARLLMRIFFCPLYLEFQVSLSGTPTPPPPSLVVPNDNGDDRVIKILSLMELLKESQAHNKTNFIKLLILSLHILSSFCCENSMGTSCSSCPPLSTTHLLFTMDRRHDGHIWTATKMSNIKNNHNLIFCYATCVGRLVRPNNSCTYLEVHISPNIMLWVGNTKNQLHS